MGILSDYKDRLALDKAARDALATVTCADHLGSLFNFTKRVYPQVVSAFSERRRVSATEYGATEQFTSNLFRIFKTETGAGRWAFRKLDIDVDAYASATLGELALQLVHQMYQVKNPKYRIVTGGDKMAAGEMLVRAAHAAEVDEAERVEAQRLAEESAARARARAEEELRNRPAEPEEKAPIGLLYVAFFLFVAVIAIAGWFSRAGHFAH